ncbi:MAG: signal peptidase II [Acidobacteriota bacterium]
MNPRFRDFSIAAGWFLLDQLTKWWASGLQGHLQVVPNFFRMELAHNTGAMFSLFETWSEPWRSLLLTALPIVAIPFLAWLLWRTPLHEVFARPALALILGGAVGNVLDRLMHGHVIDFIVVYAGWVKPDGWLIRTFGTNQWPTFNIADTGLCCGAALLLVEALFGRKRQA